MSKDLTPKKKCFVIGPIGQTGSDTRNKADFLLEYIIKPAVQKHGFKAFRADEVSEPGLISDQVILDALESDLVIADLTGQNANAFYELGIRHTGSNKPTIHMILEGQDPPFDVKDHRYITYSLDNPRDLNEAVECLSAAVLSLGSNSDIHNPVTRAKGLKKLSDSKDTKDQIIASLVEKTARLEREVKHLFKAENNTIDIYRDHMNAYATEEAGNLSNRYAGLLKATYNQEYLDSRDKEAKHKTGLLNSAPIDNSLNTLMNQLKENDKD